MASLIVRLSQPNLNAPVADLFPNGRLIVDGYGRKAVQWIQAGPWADARFVKATGRSRKAWKYTVQPKGLGLTVYNDATNRYGTRYAPYVHYAGTPRSAVVVDMVQAHLQGVIAKEMLQALGRDFRAGLKRRGRG